MYIKFSNFEIFQCCAKKNPDCVIKMLDNSMEN